MSRNLNTIVNKANRTIKESGTVAYGERAEGFP